MLLELEMVGNQLEFGNTPVYTVFMHPILLQIGPVTVYSFGIFAVLACLLGLFIFWREMRRFVPDTELIIDCALFAIVGALIGGRLLYVILHFGLFWPNVLDIFNLFSQSGFIYYGMLVGGALMGSWYAKKKHISRGLFLGTAALASSLAHAIGMVGAFLAGSAYGAVTSWPWGVSMVGLADKRHPAQLVEAVYEFILFGILLYVYRKKRQKGSVFVIYILAYALGRIVIEFLRGDSVYWLMLKSQWFFSACAALAMIAYIIYTAQNNRTISTQRKAISYESGNPETDNRQRQEIS